MRKVLFLVLSVLGLTSGAMAQDFLNLPPMVTTQKIQDTSLSFLFSTFDMRRFKGNKTQLYVNALQIVDAATPWPPRWYTTAPLYTDSMYRLDTASHLWRLYFLFDPKVDHGQFSFFKELTLTKIGEEKAASGAGYIILNKKMEPVDTVRSNSKSALYYHDFRVNDKGERLVDIKTDTILDMRVASGEQKDSAVRSKFDIVEILDKDNNVVFSWNSLEHLDPNVFQFKESLKSHSFSSADHDIIEWSRLTSAIFDYDGDILYSMRFVGLGKISRKDGHVIWHIDFKDVPFVSYGDTLKWFSIHDFDLVGENDTGAIYRVFSLGDDSFPHPGGVIFERNKTSGKIKLVRYIYSKKEFVGMGQGNCDLLDNGKYILNYGIFAEDDTTDNFRAMMEYGNRKDSILATYLMPKLVYAYKVHRLQNWPLPPRPTITKQGSTLVADGPMEEGWTWYKLSGVLNSEKTEAGTGKTLKLRGDGTYCVEAKYGMGYSVSLPFIYKAKDKNSPY